MQIRKLNPYVVIPQKVNEKLCIRQKVVVLTNGSVKVNKAYKKLDNPSTMSLNSIMITESFWNSNFLVFKPVDINTRFIIIDDRETDMRAIAVPIDVDSTPTSSTFVTCKYKQK